jgi:hypothetical protein
MTKEATMIRRVAMLAAGLAMTASVGLAGADSVSAASPSLLTKPGSQWTTVILCEVVTFAADGTFKADYFGDAGKWSGGTRSTLHMKWTKGEDKGWSFTALSYKGALKEYEGLYGPPSGPSYEDVLRKGALTC